MQNRYSGANEDHCAVIDAFDGAILSESEIVDLLNSQELKASSIKHQVEELRTLTETVKQVLENQFISKDDKLLFLKTFPEDLTAFADGLDQILADFKRNDAYDPVLAKEWDEMDKELCTIASKESFDKKHGDGAYDAYFNSMYKSVIERESKPDPRMLLKKSADEVLDNG